MQIKKFSTMFLMFLAMVSLVNALPIRVDSVDIDGVILTNVTSNRLDVERGQDLNIAVRMTGLDAAKNVEVEAFISGFEFSDVERVSDTTGLFDVLQNVTYLKRLVIPLPSSLDKDDYKLRVIITDRDNNEYVQNYNLKIDVPRHLVAVKDIILTPENEIAAGGILLASVRVENLGSTSEDDVKVNVAMPALGVSATKYISKVTSDGESESEEVFLRLPECAPAGRYDIFTKVSYADGHRSVNGKSSILVTKNELCDGSDILSDVPPGSKIVINIGSNSESVSAGNTAVFPITVSNKGLTSKGFTVLPASVDWADIAVSPTTTTVLAPGKSETFYIYSKPNDNAVGSQVFTVSVSSSNELLKQVPLTVKVVEPVEENSGGLSLKRVLEVGLIVLLVLLIIVGLIIGFTMLNNHEEEPPQQAEPYY